MDCCAVAVICAGLVFRLCCIFATTVLIASCVPGATGAAAMSPCLLTGVMNFVSLSAGLFASVLAATMGAAPGLSVRISGAFCTADLLLFDSGTSFLSVAIAVVLFATFFSASTLMILVGRVFGVTLPVSILTGRASAVVTVVRISGDGGSSAIRLPVRSAGTVAALILCCSANLSAAVFLSAKFFLSSRLAGCDGALAWVFDGMSATCCASSAPNRSVACASLAPLLLAGLFAVTLAGDLLTAVRVGMMISLLMVLVFVIQHAARGK